MASLLRPGYVPHSLSTGKKLQFDESVTCANILYECERVDVD